MKGAAAVGGGAALAVLTAPLLLAGLLVATVTSTVDAGPPGLDLHTLPATAQRLLPELQDLLAANCPDLPVAWAVADAQVESGWNPAAYNAQGRAAGLYQLTEPSWTAAGGHPWATQPPPAGADVFQPDEHLRRAIPWMCANLHTVTEHLAATGKAADPHDALAVCHVAGCGRVTGSATGIPAPGEAGCDATCAKTVRDYIDRIHTVIEQLTPATGPVGIGDLPAPTAYRGTGGGCTAPDPNGHGCLTPIMRWTLDQTLAAFGPPGPDHPIRALSCWDPHTWNPSSDHPRGRACDFFPTRAGTFPSGTDLANGWRLATWLRTHAAALHVAYIIWQGRFWSPTTADRDGWGEPYNGGGIYNPRDATGGHFDHVHLSSVN
jgi:hypothetical protein